MVVVDGHEYLTEEEKRLKEDRDRVKYWKKWGPYVAERQWATGSAGSLPRCWSRLVMLTPWRCSERGLQPRRRRLEP